MKPSRFIKIGISSLVYFNIFIALCSAAYTAKTSLLLVGTNGSFRVNGIVFCATLLFYCFHRINKRKFLISGENLVDRNNWMSANKKIYYVLIAISFILITVQVFYMPLRTGLVFIPVALLGAGYTFPVIPTRKGWKRLRDIYGLKTFWIAVAFSWLTTLFPVVYADSVSSLFKPEVMFIFIRALLFIFAICIPFDIRDLDFDKLKGVITLPIRFGIKASIYIAITLLLLFILLVGIDFLYFNLNIGAASALLLSAIITILLLPLAKPQRPALMFPLLYDSAMLVQWLLLLAMTRY